MAFVQIMEFSTSKYDEARAAGDAWAEATEGRRTVRRSVMCQDRDHPGRYFILVFFDSHDDAMKNSALPETDALAEKMAGLAESPPTFYNLDVLDELI